MISITMNRKIKQSVSFPNLKKDYGYLVFDAKQLAIDAGINRRGQKVRVKPTSDPYFVKINGVKVPADWI